MAFGRKKDKKKPVKKQFVKCNGAWTVKLMGNDGKWTTYQRYCSLEAGHKGAHR